MVENVGEWHAKFIDMEQEMLVQVILAANYLEISELLQLGCAQIASMIKYETPEDIRRKFNIATPTPEEEEEIRKQHPWIDE